MALNRADNRRQTMNNVKARSSIEAASMNSYQRVTEEDGVIVQLVSQMILDAYNNGASDIHLEDGPGEADALASFKINGKYQEYRTIPYTYKSAVFSRIKRMSYLDVAERSLPQDGKIEFKKYAPLDLELRVASTPTTGGNEDVVMALLVSGEPIVVR
jgi:type II secretory ATPase GspE/PulE/Tfp pilus assembly ATPase PilB-like protein